MGKKALVIRTQELDELFSISHQEKVQRKIRLISGEYNGVSFYELGNTMLADRTYCETDPTLVQFIPYITLRRWNSDLEQTEFFTYVRGKAGGENRLHDLMSVGLGGHVEEIPDYPKENLFDVIKRATIRELEEEVGEKILQIEKIEERIQIGLENAIVYLDTTTPTESVHLGLFINIGLPYTDLNFALEEAVVTEPKWIALNDLREEGKYNLEPWSYEVVKRFNATAISSRASLAVI